MGETIRFVDLARKYLVRCYPTGIMNGRYISDMSDAQVLAIYETLQKPRAPKKIKGQVSLFDEDYNEED